MRQQLGGGGSETNRFYDEQVYGRFYPVGSEHVIPQRFQIALHRLKECHPLKYVHVLDIGPESPSISAFIQKSIGVMQNNYHCVDVSHAVVESLAGDGYQATCCDLSTQTLPYEDEYFELVILAEVIEHLTNPDHALREIHRVLKPGGVLLLTTPNLASWVNRLLLLAGHQPLTTETSTERGFGWGSRGPKMKPVGHLRLFVYASLTEMLVNYGFRLLVTGGLPYEPGLVEQMPFKTLVRLVNRVLGLHPSLGGGLLAIAERI
jgi:SAM-dependent methyltransferase